MPPLLEVSEHLSVLPAGQSDQPMAGLTSDRMRLLARQFPSDFDWVLAGRSSGRVHAGRATAGSVSPARSCL